MPVFHFNFNLNNGLPRRPLSLWSQLLILLFGLTILLTHLGDTRVLTRHEVLAAQPAREMLHSADWRRWMLPTLAGQSREAKPPGMMWLIAASIYFFRSESEWVARLPSALAGLWTALMIARLAARWFGDSAGRLAGLICLSSFYLLMQAKLSEADMALTATVCAALCAVAEGVIDSPFGMNTKPKARWTFWLALAAAFLLKGPIGLMFVALAIATFLLLCRRDWKRILFLLDPPAIIACTILMVAWPLIAWRLDPNIINVWHSEAIGTATGKFGSDPIYYYLGSVPLMLMPWTPFVVIGLLRGPNAELSGPVESQVNRAVVWRFLLAWFIPGIIVLSIGIKLKSHHYAFPILPPLAVMGALGMDYYTRRQATRAQPLIWPWFLAACAAGAWIIIALPQIAVPMKHPLVKLDMLLCVGGLFALHYERARRPRATIAAYLLTAWAISIGVQSWVMPAQDDFKFQADFARAVNAKVPPGAVVYMLGHREEEQEAEYAYYLRFPMQRLSTAAEFASLAQSTDGQPFYAIAPAGMIPELSQSGAMEIVDRCTGLRARETESDRLQLLRFTPPPEPITRP